MIVFLTVYLGLIAGRQPIELRADPAVAAIRLLLDGKEIATLHEPPWKGTVDLGADIAPHELLAIALDSGGKEIGRASQVLNLPRPQAEVDVAVGKSTVTLQGRDVGYAHATGARVKLDGVPLALDKNFTAALPELDRKRPHVVSAEMEFADRSTARREIVFGGQFSESLPAELTPAAIVGTNAEAPGPPEACFAPLRVSLVEKGGAVLLIVRDPSPRDIRIAVRTTGRIGSLQQAQALRVLASVSADTTVSMVMATADRVPAPDQPTAFMFPVIPRPPNEGLYRFISRALNRETDGPRRWADAVAVAGVQAIAGGRRRAVILVLGKARDASENTPRSVRRYLASIGVPLFVWSNETPPADAAQSWGEVTDISTGDKLSAATDAVSRALDGQRIAWLYADPLTAVRARARDGCGYMTLARD